MIKIEKYFEGVEAKINLVSNFKIKMIKLRSNLNNNDQSDILTR